MFPYNEEPMKRHAEEQTPDLEPPLDRKQEALHVLIKARENLLAQMAEEILLNRDSILGDPAQTGLLGFEFQEIEDRYIGRLNSINAILDNLEPRPSRIVNKTEVLFSSRKELKKDLDDLIDRYDQWDLVSVSTTRVSDDQFMLLVAFSADEYPASG